MNSVSPGRVDVLGVGVSLVTMESACDEVERWIREGESQYVCVTGVHGVMESQSDPELVEIHNRSGLTVPDGMPMVWAAHWAGADHVERVSGPDILIHLLDRARRNGWSSFFYGGKEGVADLLASRLQDQLPGLEVAGTYSPPFRPLTDDEERAVVEMINESGSDLVWVGLSTPKQERWMARNIGRLDASGLLGVGAAFDLHAGFTTRAPMWMQRSGLEWFYRLAVEPQRLWRRYLTNNPRFLVRVVRRPPRLASYEH